jgi:hypothetical protein
VDEGLNVGMGMPGWLLYPATLLALLVLAYPFYRARSLIARYALFALSFRYLAGAHHTVTFMASPIGMSWNAIGSSGVFLMGLVLIKARHLLLKQLIPFYLLVIAVVLSALGNHNISGMLDVVVKYGYLIIITIAVYEALSRMGEQRGMGLLLWAMVTPVLFQVLSIAFGITKGSEADGSISFIGGYHHESPFSIVLATGFVIACFATGMKVWVRGAILLVLLMGLVLANYRTVLIAIAPLAFVQFNLDFIGRFPKRQRIIIGIAVLGFSSLGALAAAWVMRERFTDLLTVLSDPGALIKEPQYYTPDERKLMSGRPYIWAAYIDGYLDGGAKTLLVGYGPSAWVGRFAIYAHNTLVSTLYEYGILGVLAMISVWVSMFVAALRVDGPRGKLLTAHASFFLLNMATMPHWMLEGNILYGIICGYTFYRLLSPAKAPALRATSTPLQMVPPIPRPNILR